MSWLLRDVVEIRLGALKMLEDDWDYAAVKVLNFCARVLSRGMAHTLIR